MAHASPSLEELFEFERLLFDLSVRFANVSADRVVDEIDRAHAIVEVSWLRPQRILGIRR